MSEAYALQMPSNFVLMDTDEMEYVDAGGVYMSYNTLVGIVTAIGANPYSVASIASCAKWSAGFLCAKLGSMLGPVGVAIGGAISLWFVKQAGTFAERTFSAIMRRKGVQWSIKWEWGIIPGLDGTLR